MDALKFFKERMRMCDYYPRCFECSREDEPNCNIEEMSYEEFENFVNTVEQWSKEHPPLTRLQDFMEKYPNAQICESGVPSACCKSLGYCKSCDPVGNNCEVCWNMSVGEDDE